MSTFDEFKVAVQVQFEKMNKSDLFVTEVAKDDFWDMYLGSFEEGTNPIHKERTVHDCQCCKQFIRTAGTVVSIVDNKLVSIWDINIGGIFQPVADALSKLAKSKPISNTFLHFENSVGTDFNHQMQEDESVVRWDHFHLALPSKFVAKSDNISSTLSKIRSTIDVFARGMNEISLESAHIVLELIDQNSLYRGAEHKATVIAFIEQKTKFDKIDAVDQAIYCWKVGVDLGPIARTRNTVIGTLLVDLSVGVELDRAVASFETKVAPTNYKRPTTVVTKSMIEAAQKKVIDLGIEASLQRRYAVVDDLTINNILFADRSTKAAMDVFDTLITEAPVKLDSLAKVEEVNIETFINSILPKAESIEVMMENQHSSNLMSLISAKTTGTKNIFKWGNNFSWSYNGEVADSIKERVKKAGGQVDGVLRTSLSWFNHDDLDIHVREPDNNHIYFGQNRSLSSGKLDVDMNAGGKSSREAVENIIWTNKTKMKEGVYEVWINQFIRRETIDVGFIVELEFDGVIHTFVYDKAVKNNVSVVKFNYSKTEGITIIESLPSTQASKVFWNVPTQKFIKVNMIMNSPNHWDGEETGNKHWFFILDDCRNALPSRGFFNEFLSPELIEHRKVFEVLGSKLKTEPSDNQLSGVGFSSTQKNHIICKVSGSFSRTIKIIF